MLQIGWQMPRASAWIGARQPPLPPLSPVPLTKSIFQSEFRPTRSWSPLVVITGLRRRDRSISYRESSCHQLLDRCHPQGGHARRLLPIGTPNGESCGDDAEIMADDEAGSGNLTAEADVLPPKSEGRTRLTFRPKSGSRSDTSKVRGHLLRTSRVVLECLRRAASDVIGCRA